jgi:hypothetical protein
MGIGIGPNFRDSITTDITITKTKNRVIDQRLTLEIILNQISNGSVGMYLSLFLFPRNFTIVLP